MITSFGSRVEKVFDGVKRSQLGKLVFRDCRKTVANVSEGRHSRFLGVLSKHCPVALETEKRSILSRVAPRKPSGNVRFPDTIETAPSVLTRLGDRNHGSVDFA